MPTVVGLITKYYKNTVCIMSTCMEAQKTQPRSQIPCEGNLRTIDSQAVDLSSLILTSHLGHYSDPTISLARRIL